MTHKTQAEAHSCINPQCNPAKCSGCACAIPPSDEAGHVVLDLLNAFAVNDLGHPFEDGDSAAVDRARQWLQNRSTALQAAPPAPAAVAVPGDLEQIRVGRLPTMNQDEYPGLGDWWVQLRIGSDGDEVLARVYGNSPEQAHARAEAIDAAPAQAVAVPVAPAPETVAWLNKPILVQDGEKVDDLPPTVDFERHAADHEWEQAEPLVRLSDALAYAQSIAAPAQEHATPLAGQGAEVIENLLRLAQIVDRAVEDWGESFPDGSCDVKFHKDEAVKMEAILEFFDSLPDAPEDEGVIESGPLKAARAIRAAEPAQAQEDARDADSDKVLLDFLRDTSCDLRSIDVPTGGDDSDVHWRVIEHHMSEPREREIGRSWTDDPREAIRAARAAQGGA